MTRAPELDVARALAVGAVLVGHAGYSAGFVPLAERGVDVFFVLSGYLCAVQLERGARPGPWLVRRLRRIYPAAWAVLAVAGAPPLVWTLLAFGGGRVVGHTWSLSVEVVGYVGLAALALAPRRLWRPALLGVAVGCVVARHVVDPHAAYTVWRWDGMAVGALWALSGAPSARWLLPALGVALVLPYTTAPAVAALGAVGLLSALRGTTLRGGWLCSRSYALYLVSVPMIEVFGFVGLVATFPLAEALFRVVDRPLGLRQ
jgi:peptidoglycan/LPS O-acetylase OafA/YrhL